VVAIGCGSAPRARYISRCTRLSCERILCPFRSAGIFTGPHLVPNERKPFSDQNSGTNPRAPRRFFSSSPSTSSSTWSAWAASRKRYGSSSTEISGTDVASAPVVPPHSAMAPRRHSPTVWFSSPSAPPKNGLILRRPLDSASTFCL
jgi:hypothetical protein